MDKFTFNLQRFAQTVNLSTGNDNFGNDSNDVIIYAFGGDDTVQNLGSRVGIYGGAGRDSLYNYDSYINRITNVTLDGGDDDDTINNIYVNNASINGGTGNDYIYSSDGNSVTVNGDAGNDSVYSSWNNKVSIFGGDGNDSIRNYYSDTVTIDGGAGADKISIGVSNSVTANGGDGNDTILGYQSGNLLIDGGAGNDVVSLFGSTGVNTISGGAGNDTFYGGRGAHLYKFVAGDGNDLIKDFNATDTLQIGGGKGTYSSTKSGNNIIVTVGDGSISLVGAATLSTVNISGTIVEKNPLLITGTAGNDSINNTLEGATIAALGGNDSIENSAASVSIAGGAGKDSLYNHGVNYNYRTANVTLDGSDGDDIISSSYSNNASIVGGAGSDNISNSYGNSVSIDGGDGNDSISNSDGSNVAINGGDGNDSIVNFLSSKMTINGGDGNDLISNESSNNVLITGGAGIDFIENNGASVSIDGGDGNDYIYNYSSTTTINGGAGDDSITNYYGNSVTITGGAGNDKISLSGSTDNLINYTTGDGNDTVWDFGSADTLKIGNGTGSYSSTKSGNDVIVTVGNGKISLVGAASLSALNISGTLLDTLDSSSSSATLMTVTNSDKSPMTIGAAVKTVDASARTKMIKIAGNDLDNSIVGGTKNDSLHGAAGNDTLNGGAGNDTLTGGAGKDVFVYNTGDGNDVITDYTAGEDKIQIAPSDFKSASVKGSDVIFAIGSGKLTVKNGKEQKITLVDETGKVFEPKAEPVSINSAQTAIKILDNFEATVFDVEDYGTKFKTIDGSAATVDLEIYGNKFANKIIGSDGNDTFNGGAGNDTLTGGAGKDVFVYNTGDGNDVITDYTEGEDKIQIAPSDFKSASVKGSDVIFAIGSGKLTVKNGKEQKITLVDETGKVFEPAAEPVSINSAQTAIKILDNFEDTTFYVEDYGTKFKTIDGSAATVDLEIFGNKLANKIIGSDGNDTFNGGAGNDTLTGGAGEDIFVYNTGDGNDVITDYTEGEDKIQIAPSDFKSASVKGSDVIFAIGSGKLTVKNGKDQKITLVDETGKVFEPAAEPVSINSAQTAIKILDNFEDTTFYVEDYGTKFKTIDGSAATIDLEIFGNKLANKIIGSDGNDTFNGGAGNDTLTGGAGEDIFVYNTGDGNDVITDYTAGEDKIQIAPSDFNSVTEKGSDVIFAIGSGKLTVKNGKEQEIILVDENGDEFDYKGDAEPVSINSAQTAIKILESYEETIFDVADYGTKFKTIDASAATVDLEIYGNKLANKIYGSDGSDILVGGAGNDSLWGNNGSDTFIYDTGDGRDVIFGFEDSDMLEIMDTFTGTYNKSKNQIAFKVGSTTNAITLRDFTATTFNINGDNYQISGTKLVQK